MEARTTGYRKCVTAVADPFGPKLSTGQTADVVASNVSQNQTGTSTGSVDTTQNPIFNAGQQTLQGLANQTAGQIASGQTANYGLPANVQQAAWAQFNNNVLPMISAQNGAGSPAMQSAQQQFALQLAAQSGQMQNQNAQQAFQNFAGIGYNPIGMNQSQTNSANSTTQGNTSSQAGQININQQALGDVLGFITKLFT